MVSENRNTIFISYGRDPDNPQDIDLVRKVKEDLENSGFRVLMDEEQLRTGSKWWIKLENMIDDSDWILYFLTPYSARRPDGFCLKELSWALDCNKQIAPVMLKYIKPPILISDLQYLDFKTTDDNDDYKKKLDEIISVLSEEKIVGFEGENLTISHSLKPIKFKSTIAKNIYGFTGREWVYEEVDKWLEEDSNSRVLWMHAKAGFGKTAISTYLANKHSKALGIYFCQFDYKESKKPIEMLKVLIYQLSTQLDEYHKILQTINIKDEVEKSAEHIFSQLLIEPLYQIKKPKDKHFFIIDGLDEAKNNGTNQILELIANRFADLPSWLNIVVTSRIEPELLRKLKKFNPVELKTDDKRNRDDLKFFLEKNKNIKDGEIVKALIKKSEGNILYLKAIFELDMIKNNRFSLENIEELPPSMEGFYCKYFERKFEDKELYEERYLKFISILVAKKGMPELLVKDILKLSEREYTKIKSSFGSLLEVDDNNLTFYHKTIYEWLNDYDKSEDYSADLELGINIFEKFIDNLTSSSYKEEYLKFQPFNQNIIDKIYEEYRSLENYFELLSSVINDKKKVETLINLGHYYLHNNILISIEILEPTLEIVNKLYEENADLWAIEYTSVLNNLAASYKNNKVIPKSKSIALLKQSLEILKEYYKKTPIVWAEKYSVALNNLAFLFAENNKVPKAIELWEESLPISNELSKSSKLYMDRYIELLVRLSVSYSHMGVIPESKKYAEQVLPRLAKLYQDNPKQWVNYYSLIQDIDSGINKQEKTKDKIKRNDLCPCDSGKKYKKCCGKN